MAKEKISKTKRNTKQNEKKRKQKENIISCAIWGLSMPTKKANKQELEFIVSGV